MNLHLGDSLEVLKTLPENSVTPQGKVTSKRPSAPVAASDVTSERVAEKPVSKQFEALARRERELVRRAAHFEQETEMPSDDDGQMGLDIGGVAK